MGLLREVTLRFFQLCFPGFFEKLRVSLNRGQVDSTDVVLSKSDPFSVLGIPLQLAEGTLAGMCLKMPWMNGGGTVLSIAISSIYVNITEVSFPCQLAKVIKALEDEEQRAKFRLLAEGERAQGTVWRSIQDVLLHIVNRLELDVGSIKLRIDFTDGFVAELSVAKLTVRRPAETSKRRKRILEVHVHHITITLKSTHADDSDLLKISPFSLKLTLELDGDTLRGDLDVWGGVRLRTNASLLEFLRSLERKRSRWYSAYAWGRPSAAVRMDGKAWIQYAYRAVLDTHSISKVSLKFEQVLKSLRAAVEYKNFHVRRLSQTKLGELELIRISELENLLSVEAILLLRERARGEVIADEISAFGASEWLRWVIFGHRSSSERERLTAEVRRSLDLATRSSDRLNSESTYALQSGLHPQRYIFSGSLETFSFSYGANGSELEISMDSLSLSGERTETNGDYQVSICVEDLAAFVDGVCVARKEADSDADSEKSSGDLCRAAFTVDVVRSRNEIRLSVKVENWLVCVGISSIQKCLSITRSFTIMQTVSHAHHSQILRGGSDEQGPCSSHRSKVKASVSIRAVNASVALFDDTSSSEQNMPFIIVEVGPSLTLNMSNNRLRTSEFDVCFKLHGVECESSFPLHSRKQCWNTKALLREGVSNLLSISSSMQLVFGMNARLTIGKTTGMVWLPGVSRVLRALRHSCSFLWEYLSNERSSELCGSGESDICLQRNDGIAQAAGFEVIFILSYLHVRVNWNSSCSNNIIHTTLEADDAEVVLGNPAQTFSLRIKSVRWASEDGKSHIEIRGVSELQNALTIRGQKFQDCDSRHMEIFSGKVDGHLQAGIVRQIVSIMLSPEMFLEVSKTKTPTSLTSSSADRANSSFSIHVAFLKLTWRDMNVSAQMTCFDVLIAADKRALSVSSESMELIDLGVCPCTGLGPQTIVSRSGIGNRNDRHVLSCTFLANGVVLDVSRFIITLKRCFWEDLVSSLASVTMKGESKIANGSAKNSSSAIDESSHSFIRMYGSHISFLLPVPALGKTVLHLQFSRITYESKPENRKVFCRQAMILLERNSWTTESRDNDYLLTLQALDFDLCYKHRSETCESTLQSQILEEWELKIMNSVALSLAPRTVSCVISAFATLLSPCHRVETARSNAAVASSDRDDPEQGKRDPDRKRTLFHCSARSLRLDLSLDHAKKEHCVFAALEVHDLRLSTASVESKRKTGDAKVSVYSYHGTFRDLLLYKQDARSPESVRMALGSTHHISSHGSSCDTERDGLNIDLEGRHDHAGNSWACDFQFARSMIAVDIDFFERLVQYAISCFSEAKRIIVGVQDEKTMDSVLRADKEASSSVLGTLLPAASVSKTMPIASYQACSRIRICMEDTLIVLKAGDEFRVSETESAQLSLGLVKVSYLMSQYGTAMPESSARIQKVHLCLYRKLQGVSQHSSFRRDKADSYASYFRIEPWRADMLSTEAASLGKSEQIHYRHECIIKTEEVSARLKDSSGCVLAISAEKLYLNVSIPVFSRLLHIFLVYRHKVEGIFALSMYNSAPKITWEFRIREICVTLRLGTVHNAGPDADKEKEDLMRVNVTWTITGVYGSEPHILRLRARIATEIIDVPSGHCDQLISPFTGKIDIVRGEKLFISVTADQLLRISISPITTRLISIAIPVAKGFNTEVFTSNDSESGTQSEIELSLRIPGLAVRCLAESPRIQILRLLLREIKLHGVLPRSIESSWQVSFTVREVLLEDTISWRVFPNDPSRPFESRWTRVLATKERGRDTCIPRTAVLSSVLSNKGSSHSRLMQTALAGVQQSRASISIHFEFRSCWDIAEVRIESSEFEVNIDMAVFPMLLEWSKSMFREFSFYDDAQLDQNYSGHSSSHTDLMQVDSFKIVLDLSPLTLGFRAIPPRLQGDLSGRVLSRIFSLESVTGLTIGFPLMEFGQNTAQTLSISRRTRLKYLFVNMGVAMVSQILAQAKTFWRLAGIFALSHVRWRPYNALDARAIANEEDTRSQHPEGLQIALQGKCRNDDEAPGSAFNSLVVERVPSLHPALSGASIHIGNACAFDPGMARRQIQM